MESVSYLAFVLNYKTRGDYGEGVGCSVVTVPIFLFTFPSHKNFQIPYSGFHTVEGVCEIPDTSLQ